MSDAEMAELAVKIGMLIESANAADRRAEQQRLRAEVAERALRALTVEHFACPCEPHVAARALLSGSTETP